MKIKEIINSYLDNWIERINEDEWYFSNMRDNILLRLNNESAFKSLPEIVDIVLEQTDEYLCSEMFQLLLDVVIKTETTEMPIYLNQNWDKLIDFVSSFDTYHKQKADELKKWYRR